MQTYDPISRVLLVVTVILLASTPYVWGDPITKAPLPPDMQRITDRGTLIVAMFHLDRPPFFYTDDEGQVTGYEPEMARDIARLLGVEVVFDRVAQSFDEVVDRVVAGYADVAISKLSLTLPRARRASFTEPHLVFHRALLVNRLHLAAAQAANPHLSAVEAVEQSSLKLAVRRGTAWVNYAQEMFPRAELVLMDSMKELVTAAARGEVLAVLYDEYEIQNYMQANPALNIDLRIVIIPEQLDPIAIAVAPDDVHLLQWLNTYLRYATVHLQLRQLQRDYSRAYSH